MGIRAPHPIKAAKSLVRAWKGETPMLYRIVYETDSGAEGVFLYLDGEHIEPYVVKNTHEMHIPELEYAVIGTYKTEINGESVPLKELQDVALVDDPEETMRLPKRFENKTMPEIDRMMN